MKWKCLQCLLAVLVHHHGGQVVSVLAFYSDNHSSNPAAAYSFSVKLCLKERLNINSVFLSARKTIERNVFEDFPIFGFHYRNFNSAFPFPNLFVS